MVPRETGNHADAKLILEEQKKSIMVFLTNCLIFDEPN